MAKQNKGQHLVSVIIPAFKQEKTILQDLRRIMDVMNQLRYDYEIILVVDGLLDDTLQNAKKIHSKKLIVTGYKSNNGKGHAIRYGMSKSKGDIIAFIDSGMDINPNGISMLLEHYEWYNADIIVGSKLHPVSKINYPFGRRLLSWGYRTLVKIMFGLSIRDTQVGMKVFRRKTLEDVLPRLLVKKFAFDIELLAVTYHLGHKRIYEAPIELDFKNASTISSLATIQFWKIIISMLWDTFAVFYRLKIIHYYDNKNIRKWKYDPELNFNVNI